MPIKRGIIFPKYRVLLSQKSDSYNYLADHIHPLGNVDGGKGAGKG
jgi:hypothetical protein